MLLIIIISLTEISNAWLGSNSNRYNDEKSRAIRDLTNRKGLFLSNFWRISQFNLGFGDKLKIIHGHRQNITSVTYTHHFDSILMRISVASVNPSKSKWSTLLFLHGKVKRTCSRTKRTNVNWMGPVELLEFLHSEM